MGQLPTTLLLAVRGTVTETLERICGEPISVTAVQNKEQAEGYMEDLDLRLGQPFVRRFSLLNTSRSMEPLVRAECLIAPERLPFDVWQAIEASTKPIGRIIVEHRLECFRELVSSPPLDAMPVVPASPHLRPATAAVGYRIIVRQAPAIAIREWYLDSPGMPLMPGDEGDC